MKYEKIVRATYVDRPNRFIAHADLDGRLETVHVKNTGRCKELLIPGRTIILEDFRDRAGFESRKTKFDLVAVYKRPNLLINMDSQAPNKVVMEWLKSLEGEEAFDFIKPEYTFGKSRVDFYMEKGDQKFLMEVKGCTLEKDGLGYFPDAPTERGVKHLHELRDAVALGYHCFIAFVIQVPGVQEVYPNVETHPEFGQALQEAQAAGVKVLYLQCRVEEGELEIIKNGSCKSE